MSDAEKPVAGPTIPTRRCPADGCGANYLQGSSGAWFCPHGHGVLAVAKEGATVIRFGSWGEERVTFAHKWKDANEHGPEVWVDDRGRRFPTDPGGFLMPQHWRIES